MNNVLDRIKKYIKNDNTILMLGAVCIGAAAFCLIYGVGILDVRYDDWLYSGGGDLTQHYFGWLFYRKSDWTFPLGMIQGLSDFDTSIIYIDSIPLFAIFFKLFRNILPETFQYFGLWGLFSYVMMGVASVKLLRKFSDNKFICWIGSIFFITAPFMMRRMHGHSSLGGGQWLIVLAIFFWLDNVGKDSIVKKTIAWCCLLGLAPTIHMYFIPMVAMFLLADVVRLILDKKYIKALICFISPILVTLLIMGVLGAFTGKGDFSSDGLGVYSANLNTLYNSAGMSKWVKELPKGHGQYEGIGYLGLGIMILCIVDLFYLAAGKLGFLEFWKKNKLQVITGVIICILFQILAYFPVVMWNDKTILTIHYPEIITRLMSIFRAAGRFIWPVCYLIFFVSLASFAKRNKGWKAAVFLGFLVVLQLGDISPYISTRVHTYGGAKSEYVNPLTEEAWSLILSGKEKVVYLPYNTKAETMYAIGEMANRRDMKFSAFNIARLEKEKCVQNDEKYRIALRENGGEDSLVYIFSGIDDIIDEDFSLYYYMVDNIIVGLKKEVHFPDSAAVTELSAEGAHQIPLTDMALMNMNSGERSATSGDSVTIKSGQILFGPYYGLNPGSYECTITGENLSQLSWSIASDGSRREHTFDMLGQSDEEIIIKIDLEKAIDDIEIKGRNESGVDVLINGIQLEKITE